MPFAFLTIRPRVMPFVLSFMCGLILVAGCNSSTTDEKTAGGAAEKSSVPGPGDTSAESVPLIGDESAKPVASGTNEEAPVLEASDDATIAEAPTDVAPGTDPLLTGAPRKTVEGWWRIVLSVSGGEEYPSDYSAGFVKIGKSDEGNYRIEEINTNDIVNPAKMARSEVTDQTVIIYFDHEENKFDYQGTLDDGIVRGTLQFANPRQNLVRLTPVTAEVATKTEELDRTRLGTTFGSEEIVEALQSDERVNALKALSQTWRKSPVLFTAYDILLQNAPQFELDRPTIESLATDFEAAASVWGDRAVQAARLNTAADLLLHGDQTDLAEAKLALVRSDAPELLEAWDELLTVVRERGLAEKARRERIAAMAEAQEQINSGDVETGVATLRRLHQERPIDPIGTYRLAKALQEHGPEDEALNLFARLAALPQTELELREVAAEPDYSQPRVTAAKLYENKNGNRDGFDDFLMTVYRDSVVSFLTDDDRNRQPSASPRTTLVELFTGSTCPPCVAADVATEAIEGSFPASDAVVLRYHVHIPGPDPLANTDTLARMDYYGAEIGGTPTVLIDGEKVPYNIGGAYSNSPDVYAELAKTVADVAEKQPAGEINLTASVNGETLQIQASAAAPEAPADTVRLRIVIAESHIDYAARNGIKAHEMVVREMPGGAAGIAAADGNFNFQQNISLLELRERLNDYLESAEKSLRTTFGDRPLALRRLTVVAFLQNDTTREILQAVVVPIEQDVELPPMVEEAAADGETAEESDEPGPALGPQE